MSNENPAQEQAPQENEGQAQAHQVFATGMKPSDPPLKAIIVERTTPTDEQPPEPAKGTRPPRDYKFFLVGGEIIRRLDAAEEKEMKRSTPAHNYKEISEQFAEDLLKSGRAKPCASTTKNRK